MHNVTKIYLRKKYADLQFIGKKYIYVSKCYTFLKTSNLLYETLEK